MIEREVVNYWMRESKGAPPSELRHRMGALVEMLASVFHDRDARQIAEFTAKVMIDSMKPPVTEAERRAATRKPKRA
jgi:hypothetical protein